MFCKNCGTQIPDNQPFCPKCGSPNPAVQQPQYNQQQQPQYNQQPYGQQPYGQQPYGQQQYAPVRPPRQPRPAVDLSKLFTLIAAGLLLLAIVFTLFKCGATISYSTDNNNNPTTSTNLTRVVGFDTDLMTVVNFVGIACLLMTFFGAIKNKIVGTLLAAGASLSVLFCMLTGLLALGDNNNITTQVVNNVTRKFGTGFSLSVWGWFMLIIQLGAVGLCGFLVFLSLKDKNKK